MESEIAYNTSEIVYDTSEMESLVPFCATFEDFSTLLESMNAKKLGMLMQIRAILFGPVLWPLCILGMVFNALVLLACFSMKYNTSSIILGFICSFSLIHATFTLLQHDMSQSMSKESTSQNHFYSEGKINRNDQQYLTLMHINSLKTMHSMTFWI